MLLPSEQFRLTIKIICSQQQLVPFFFLPVAPAFLDDKRARYGDIQVGESNLFEDSFKEVRFNGWTVGELHVLDRRIVPQRGSRGRRAHLHRVRW